MSSRILFHLDAARCVAWLWQDGLLTREASFATGPSGADEFAEWLGRRPPLPCALLADVAEEAFQVEPIPFVRGKDRRTLIRRKEAQLLHGSPLTAFRSLGREKAGRRDEHVLFLGLPQSAFFEPWLAAVRGRRLPFAGLYSGALVADVLARRIRQPAPRFLLMNAGQAGIRVSYFDEGRLRFSHLAPAAFDGAGALARATAAETARFCGYLHAQRLAARDASLPCLVLAHPDDHGAFADNCPNTSELEYLLLDLEAIARGQGLRSPQVDSDSDPLWLHLAASRPPGEQFAPPKERYYHRVDRLRRALIATAAGVGMAALLLAGVDAWKAAMLENQTAIHSAASAGLEARLRARLASLPPLPVQEGKLRAMAIRYAALEHRSAHPRDMFRSVSQVLERFPDVALESLQWSLEPVAGSGGGNRGAPPSMIVSAGLKCRLAPGVQAREQIERVDGFVEALRSIPATTVTVVSRPMDAGPGALLKGGDGEKEAVPADFEVRLRRTL